MGVEMLHLVSYMALLYRATGQVLQSCDHAGSSTDYPCLSLVTRQETWMSAQEYCATSQGRLYIASSPDSQTRLQNFVDMVRSSTTSVPDFVWLGAYSMQSEYWSWSTDGTPLEYQGCYQDMPEDRDLEYFIFIRSLSPDACRAYCDFAKYNYYGLQNGDSCYCGNSFGRYGLVNTGCTVPCVGSSEDVCGGTDANSVGSIQGTRVGRWLDGHPRDAASLCALIDPGAEYSYVTQACDQLQFYICKLENGIYCPAGTPVEDGYYDKGALDFGQCYFVSTVKRNWFQAELHCRGQGGSLVKIPDEFTLDEVRQMISKRLGGGEQGGDFRPWIGLGRLRWEWHQGNGLSFMAFSNWTDFSPSIATEACLAAVTNNQSEWTDRSCDQLLAFICETASPISIPPVNTEVTTADTADATTIQSELTTTIKDQLTTPRDSPWTTSVVSQPNLSTLTSDQSFTSQSTFASGQYNLTTTEDQSGFNLTVTTSGLKQSASTVANTQFSSPFASESFVTESVTTEPSSNNKSTSAADEITKTSAPPISPPTRPGAATDEDKQSPSFLVIVLIVLFISIFLVAVLIVVGVLCSRKKKKHQVHMNTVLQDDEEDVLGKTYHSASQTWSSYLVDRGSMTSSTSDDVRATSPSAVHVMQDQVTQDQVISTDDNAHF